MQYETRLKKKLSKLISLTLLSIPYIASASDFSLPFINVSDLGTAYSGWAAVAEDASTAFSNPAGLTEIHNYQLVFPAIGLLGYTTFYGKTKTPGFPFPFPKEGQGSASSKLEAFMPSFYFAAPVNKCLTVGFFQTNPFALGTEYENDSIVRYLATKSKVVVVDAGPCFGCKVTDQLSIGAGLDIQYLSFTLNHMFGPPFSFPLDSEQKNDEWGWGYGWHGGLLYKINRCARIGLNFNSRTWFHAKGNSRLYTPFPPYRFETDQLRSDAPLPERAQLSLHLDLTSQWAFMSTVYWTHWHVFNELKLRNVMFFGGNTTDVTIPFNYTDTLDYSAGVSYKATERWTLRTGAQYMESPSDEKKRSVGDPVGPAIIVGVGARYVQNCHLSYDVGYGHSFFKDQTINNANPLVIANGYTHTQSNLVGIQINWNL